MFNNKKILLLAHHNNVPGKADQLRNYFLQHFQIADLIMHPLSPKSDTKSMIFYDKKKLIFKIHWSIQFLLEGIISFFCLRKKRKIIYYDITICLDALSFLHAFILNIFFPLGKLVYYNVDFSTKRYNNWLLNTIYKKINIFSYKKCNYFFYITKKYIKDIDPNKKYAFKSFRMKHIIDMNKKKIYKRKLNSIVFSGNISYGMDFLNLVKALQKIAQSGIVFSFDIYGDGDGIQKLNNYIKKYELKKYVVIKGIISNDKLINIVLPKYEIGVAPYISKNNLITTVANNVFTGEDLSTKIVEYIGNGLPVITTRPYHEFDVIIKHKFGFLVNQENEWYNALVQLIKNKKLLREYSNNAYKFARNYNPDKILAPILSKILNDKFQKL
jgi:glycosyltransferase involved in cell wall biosynthesis